MDIKHRTGMKLFNLRRFQTKTKIKANTIRDIVFSDALPLMPAWRSIYKIVWTDSQKHVQILDLPSTHQTCANGLLATLMQVVIVIYNRRCSTRVKPINAQFSQQMSKDMDADHPRRTLISHAGPIPFCGYCDLFQHLRRKNTPIINSS